MKISISVAATPSPMPQIMFSGGLEHDLPMLAEMGFDGVDLFFPDPRAVDAVKVRRLLDENGLKAAMLASQGDLMADGLYLNVPERLPELLERSLYHLEQCAVLNTMPNVGFLRGRHDARPDSFRHMADGLARYCELAAGMGVNVLLEPICRYEIDSVLTTAQALELWKAAGEPANLTLLLDLFHMNMEEASLCGAVSAAAGRIGHVHLVENTRAVPGLGCQALGDVVDCLTRAGYEGFLGLEAVPGPDPNRKPAPDSPIPGRCFTDTADAEALPKLLRTHSHRERPCFPFRERRRW